MIHLTGHSYNSREVIQNTFSPLVGVISSPMADEICHRNNLTFVELLQPFAKIPGDAHFRDVSGTSVSVRGLRINFCDIDWRPPQTVLARKMLNEAVTNADNDKVRLLSLAPNELNLELPSREPWFEHWRETFLTVQFPADHEFTRHFISCIIVLSSSDPNIVETAQKLTQRVHQMQNMTPQKLPKWLHPQKVLNSYVVLHEASQGNVSEAQQGYELLKSTFNNDLCFLLPINSLDGTVVPGNGLTDYWAPYIRRQPKVQDGQIGDPQQQQSLSGLKTPQDGVSVISMPTMQMSSLLLEQQQQNAINMQQSTASSENDLPILHPLSPLQENATEAISTKFSISSESLVSQSGPINANVWPSGDYDADAPHGSCLNSMDIENIKHFVQTYAIRALIPYVEQLAATLNEGITNKKGVSKSLLSATKRWFVTSKPAAGVSNQNAVIYTQESSELQTRKLGDLYFMFNHYNLAFQAYHQAKRDFNADSAWQYYAGALEMAALSAFMLGTSNRKTYDYMEDAIICYLTVCKLQQFATRATLLSIECLKTARLYSEAAKQLIRMTSEDSDLRSALLLEQASYFYLLTSPPMYRKYALYIVLSGNRYSRSGQRKHAYRCYKQAYQVFQGHGWSLAEDHIQYTMAKQAYALKKLEDASQSFAHLLRRGSMQSAQQQGIFLKEYMQTQNELIKRSPELGLLPHALPQIIQDSVRVLVLAHAPTVNNAPFIPASGIDIRSNLTDETKWRKLEEMIVITAASNKPFVFKSSKYLFTKENASSEAPLAVQGEPIEIAFTLLNPIRCSITLTDIDLLWRLSLENGESLSNECMYDTSSNDTLLSKSAAVTAAIKASGPQSIVLEELNEKTLLFKITPKLTGRLNVTGVVCQVAATNEPSVQLLGSLQFESQLCKPNVSMSGAGGGSSSSSFGMTTTVFDQKLNINVLPTVPSLSVSFTPLPTDLVAGEIVPIQISLRNTGITAIDEIYVACDNPRCFSLMDRSATAAPLSILSCLKDLSKEKFAKDKEIRRQHVSRLLNTEGSPILLKAQELITLPAWIQAPYVKGDFSLRLLFYYGLPAPAQATLGSGIGGGGAYAELKYRLVRHNWKFSIHEGLFAETACVISNQMSGELGLDVNVRNLNAIHNPLVVELYINSLHLYCAAYKFNEEKLYLTNLMEIAKGQAGERCLKPSKSASFQCRLMKSAIGKVSLANSESPQLTPTQILKQRLSTISIMPITKTATTMPALLSIPQHHHQDAHTPPTLTELYGFLTKHETEYFNPNISSEEFNKTVATIIANGCDNHATIIVDWSAVVCVQNSVTRSAFGQHFIRLEYLYRQGQCPTVDGRCGAGVANTAALKKLHINTYALERVKDLIENMEDNDDVEGKRKYHTKERLQLIDINDDLHITNRFGEDVNGSNGDDDNADDDDLDVDRDSYEFEEDYWERSEQFVGKRCMLEEDPQSVVALAAMSSVIKT